MKNNSIITYEEAVKDLLYSDKVLKTILDCINPIATRSSSFLQFVNQIEKPILKLFIENSYQTIKNSNNANPPHLGEYGCLEFAGALLLLAYSSTRNDTIAITSCQEVITMVLKGASGGIFSDLIDDVINEKINIPYEEWRDVYISKGESRKLD